MLLLLYLLQRVYKTLKTNSRQNRLTLPTTRITCGFYQLAFQTLRHNHMFGLPPCGWCRMWYKKKTLINFSAVIIIIPRYF